jgi:Peptidase A4 family
MSSYSRVTLLASVLVVALLFVSPYLVSAQTLSPTIAKNNTVLTVRNPFTAGYGALGPNDSVTNINGSWIQPKVTCQKVSSVIYAAGFSVQIDGFNGKDLELVGTGGGCEYGITKYLAFYAFYPTSGEETFNLVISPGDKILASVSYSTSTQNFTAFIKDLTSGKSASATGKVSHPQRNSVEAGVVSIPKNSEGQCCLPLIYFAKAEFGMDKTQITATCYATISGVSRPIGSFGNVLKLVMTNVKGNKIRAMPSKLSSDNSSFAVSWKSSGP